MTNNVASLTSIKQSFSLSTLPMAKLIKNVALAGATGNAGSSILKALIASEQFNVTVIARKPNVKAPDGVTVKIVDFDSYNALTAAFSGQDAVIDATMSPDPGTALRIVDAAAAAGISRFVPSEFSLDPNNSETRSVPVFMIKNQVNERLKELAAQDKMTWTSISNGAFLDWNLRTGFIKINLREKKAQLLNGGSVVIPWTLLDQVGLAVAGVLKLPEATKNRALYISNIERSQKQMVELAKDALGHEGWDVSTIDMDSVYRDSLRQLQAGNVTFEVMGNMILYCNSKPELAGPWRQNDNTLLGLNALGDEDIKKLIKKIVT